MISAERVARIVSILGHPMLVMPLATWLAVRSRDATVAAGASAIGAVLLLGNLVLVFSAIQVRRGRWRHVDASSSHERRALNLFLLCLFAVAAAAIWFEQGFSPLFLALFLSAAIILLALLTSPLWKLSLHVAFIAFAAFVPGSIGVGVGIATFGTVVAWSRLKLGRHAPADLIAGLLAGVAAGIVFQTG
ncbi:hypothetical protein [Dokdonella sp.]|uniref:hypothetical protein n=1 Tax=Dokdonella sp. TaxID=2291710 RepID=UPI0035278201